MKPLIMSIAILTSSSVSLAARDMSNGADNFYQSDKVTAQKVTFRNQYKMKVAGNLFIPKNPDQNAKNPAIVVGHPMGAVKEQSANSMRRKWPSGASSRCHWICPSGARAKASHATPFCPISTPRLQCRGGFPGHPAIRRPGPDRRPRDLRQRELCHQRRQDRPAHEGNRHRQHVRHGRPPTVTGLGIRMTVEQRKKIIAEAAAQRYVEFTGGETRYTSGTVHELNEKSHPIRAGVLRLLPHATRRSHSRRDVTGTDHAPDADKQREVHELLPVQRHRDDFATSHAVHHG